MGRRSTPGIAAKAVEAKRGKFICFGENGFRELTNSKRSIASPEDLNGLKICVVGSPLFLDTFKALGANPVTMVWSDTMSAIQQGVVDGQENPINTFYPVKIYEPRNRKKWEEIKETMAMMQQDKVRASSGDAMSYLEEK